MGILPKTKHVPETGMPSQIKMLVEGKSKAGKKKAGTGRGGTAGSQRHCQAEENTRKTCEMARLVLQEQSQ